MCSTVFLREERIVGYANIIKVEYQEWGSVGNIIVASDCRGQGLGRYILDIMTYKLKEIYLAKEIRLACFSTNTSGLILYHKYGFEPYYMGIKFDNKGSDNVLLYLKKKI